MKATLGTQLRHLIELLDGAVSASYVDAGLTYRPRYTPVMRVLMAQEPATIGLIAERAGITQPAATQTIALMLKDGLITAEPGVKDGRQKVIRLSDAGREMIPQLTACWRATAAAAASLDADLAHPLSEALDGAIAALAAKPFGARIAEARTGPSQLPQPAEQKDRKK
jgi:DNA-binding MarR family transcriptional regulator